MSKLTIMQARLQAARLGCSLRKTQHGEFRVCLIGHPESHAAYETDLQSALDTAAAQYQWLKNFGRPRLDGGFIVLKQAACGKCWEIDPYCRKVFDTEDEARTWLLGDGKVIPQGFRIARLASSLEDFSKEARSEEAKGE